MKRVVRSELRNLFHEEHADALRDTFASGLPRRSIRRGV